MTSPPVTGALAVHCDDLVCVFTSSATPTVALQRVHLEMEYGETLAVVGPSGAGKSTLLGALTGAVRPTAGTVRVLGQPPGTLGRDQVRRVGVMVQSPPANLLLHATVGQNVSLVMRAAGVPHSVGASRIGELLASLELDGLATRAAGALSGGEQQRLALAVALAPGPQILLVDEPTSQQDPASARRVAQVLRRRADIDGVTVIAVTHDIVLTEELARSIVLRDGILGAESRDGKHATLVRPDGTVQLPAAILESSLPVGSRVEVRVTETGAVISRVEEQ